MASSAHKSNEIALRKMEEFIMRSETDREIQTQAFEELAEQTSPGFLWEFFDFLRNNKKWWLTPIVIILLMFGALMFLSGTAAAPFIYTLF
jgi:hypothetical protein